MDIFIAFSPRGIEISVYLISKYLLFGITEVLNILITCGLLWFSKKSLINKGRFGKQK